MVSANKQEPKSFMEMLEEILIEKYGKIIVELGGNPRNYHEIADANGFTSLTGPCGDTVKIWIRAVGDTIEDIGFRTDGCDCTRATGSMLTEMVKGKKIEEALRITPQELDEALGGLPEDHKHCALLARNALHEAIENYSENKAG